MSLRTSPCLLTASMSCHPNCRRASRRPPLPPPIIVAVVVVARRRCCRRLSPLSVIKTPYTSMVGMAGASMWGDPMPPMITVPRWTRTMLFRDDLSLLPLSLILITPHPRHPPSAFFVAFSPCWLLNIFSANFGSLILDPHISINIPPNCLFNVHSKPITFFHPPLRSQVHVLRIEWYQTKPSHQCSWCA